MNRIKPDCDNNLQNLQIKRFFKALICWNKITSYSSRTMIRLLLYLWLY